LSVCIIGQNIGEKQKDPSSFQFSFITLASMRFSGPVGAHLRLVCPTSAIHNWKPFSRSASRV